jgi:hypothetical protein
MTVLQSVGSPKDPENMADVPGLWRAYEDLAGHLGREMSIWDSYEALELSEMRAEELH